MCMRWMNEKIKRMTWFDMKCVKWSVAAAILFVLSFLLVYPSVSAFIIKWKWLWLALFILFAIKPTIKLFSKRKVERIKTRRRR